MTPTEVAQARVREVRLARGMTQADVADRLDRLGSPLDRVAVAKIETGARGVSLDDAVALALALDLPPYALIIPDDPEAKVALTPKTKATASEAHLWAVGADPLGTDPEHYYGAVSDDPWRHPGVLTLFARVHEVAEAWRDEDADEIRDAARALAREAERQEDEAARLRRRQRGARR